MLEEYGALVAATPQRSSRRAWDERDGRWAAGKRQVIEGVIGQLKRLELLLSAAPGDRDVPFGPRALTRKRRVTG